MRNKIILETEQVGDLLASLRARLPPGWTAVLKGLDREGLPPAPRASGRRGRLQPDALLEIKGPDGSTASLVIEVKSNVDPRGVPAVLEQARRIGSWPVLVLAPFLGPRTRELLAAAGASYADATGNLRIVLDVPALFIETAGATANPWPGVRPLRSLKGPAAGRVVRAICDLRPPYGIRELAQRARLSAPSVSRVVELLFREAIVEREPRGPVTRVNWAALIRRWVDDYSFTGSNVTRTFLEPRGLKSFIEKLRETRLEYSVTGSLAAVEIVPVSAARLASVFVGSIGEAADELKLRPAESGANIVLAEPFDPVAFERSWQRNNIRYAALSQVVADLLTSPGRAPVEAEELIRWMEENESAWRT